jgi:hypothetical protein
MEAALPTGARDVVSSVARASIPSRKVVRRLAGSQGVWFRSTEHRVADVGATARITPTCELFRRAVTLRNPTPPSETPQCYARFLLPPPDLA